MINAFVTVLIIHCFQTKTHKFVECVRSIRQPGRLSEMMTQLLENIDVLSQERDQYLGRCKSKIMLPVKRCRQQLLPRKKMPKATFSQAYMCVNKIN